MTVCVFVGPTIAVDAARAELQALYLPPVSQGDVCRVAKLRPRAIAIIDGFFERVPAVWHKEILWVMSQGIHVFGSSSMGALRAAELYPFGMVGIGEVFEAFRRGDLEDDDEVAVVHAPAQHGYRSLSEAMVDIRATLEAALNDDIFSRETREMLQATAKALPYPERSYDRVLTDSLQAGAPARELAAFRAWLPTGRVNQKRLDAIQLLRHIAGLLDTGLPPKQVSFHFEHTVFWDRAFREAGVLNVGPADTSDMVLHGQVIEELQLHPEEFLRALEHVSSRHLLLLEADRQRQVPAEESVIQARVEFCRARGLATAEQIENWRVENQLSEEEFARLIREEAQLANVKRNLMAEAMTLLPDHLKLTGRWSALSARAVEKQRLLEEAGEENVALRDLDVSQDDLLRWFFARADVPITTIGPGRHVAELAYDSPEGFVRAILREYRFQQRKAEPLVATARKRDRSARVTSVRRPSRKKSGRRRPE